MGVTRERFDQGITYDAYKAQMTRNRDRLDAAEAGVKIDADDLSAFKKLPKSVNVVALAEDWCGDVIANLPVLGTLAKDSGKLNVRVFLRDQNDDIMQQYLNRGEFKSIPVFVFFDESFKQLGVFTERPESVTKLRAEKRAEIFKQNPDLGSPETPADQLPEDKRAKLMQLTGKMRDDTAPFANKEVVKALRAIAGAA